jgi:NAD(P)H-dependent FMN reductase
VSLKLHTVICSTRPGRIGPSVAQWFHQFAAAKGQFQAELVDLAEFALPLYDEPKHPRLQQYEKDHTKAWAESVAAADAFVFVLPEYNFCPPPSFVNALNYVYAEWNYKPCGFVSYGGASGGLRSAQIAKQLVTTLKMMPMVESVMVQMPWEQLDEDKVLRGNPLIEKSAADMLGELAKWAQALKAMR